MNLLDRVKSRRAQMRKSWSQPPFWSLDHLQVFDNMSAEKETIENDFVGYVQGAYKRNGAVFAVMSARQMPFSQARFLWRRFNNGRPGDLFFSQELLLLETPWPGGTTGELLAHMLQDADLAGNAFLTTADDRGRYGAASEGGPGRRIVRMRPDYVELIMGSHSGDLKALDTKVIVYRFKPPGQESVAVDLLPDEVAHFSPHPDPVARFRGMSWLTPVLREIQSDSLATAHKKKFFENSAVPNLAIKFDKETGEDEFDEFVAKFKQNHQGAMNAYQTLFLMGGADVTPLTVDFKALDFTNIVGKGESRIAAAGGVPSSWVGFSEGLQGSGLNSQGVYAAARRRYADATIRPLWEMAAASLQRLLKAPSGASLWYDDREIAFLREDSKDRAEIFATEISTLSSGIMQGFDPDAMIKATRDYDIMELLGNHSGLTSVQLVASRPEQQVEQDEAEILAIRAKMIATLATSGRFTEDSIVAAVEAGDFTLLKKAELPTPKPAPPLDGEPDPSGVVGSGDGGDEAPERDEEEQRE